MSASDPKGQTPPILLLCKASVAIGGCVRSLIIPLKPFGPYELKTSTVNGLRMTRILIVEDETPVLISAETILERAGHEIVSASTVAKAQTLIHSDGKLDLVFTDISLVDLLDGGITVGLSAAQKTNGMAILYTNGRVVTDDMRAKFAKPSRFLPKPYTAQQLLGAVASLLGTD